MKREPKQLRAPRHCDKCGYSSTLWASKQCWACYVSSVKQPSPDVKKSNAAAPLDTPHPDILPGSVPYPRVGTRHIRRR